MLTCAALSAVSPFTGRVSTLRHPAGTRPERAHMCGDAPSLAELAGKPAAIDQLVALVAAGAPELDLLPAMFPFELDGFQREALNALHDGENVVVSSPTGSGKTVIGELACYLALCRGNVVIYTTPLKALSNQKFGDFQRQFGRER
eukprot:1984889-Prymnesium_polylepis.1